ncbi:MULTISPECIES: helix-hairpin-helix domain-containing protein [Chryseobacterium]|uniref:DNA uptake protein ComE-like DNA-binding protein n=1 Tax=Chryseobacterium geocarposphaerae TaxID=1416776 RepID=A0ABU1L9T2_9FLAO|nr:MULTISPECIES: helix-hairpin-helix domain-containing protein [Chryseobacterium]MDR6403484.1 DNA uptake protein ComE-like DNA-binding protein [Chryseobacterium geocarposphaerae]MDR6697038.1 DNA uptake protein ComE-like DNA-binding protein [Chryseobacterium ginsenosidimutans]
MKKDYYRKVAFMGMLLIILLAFQKYTSKNKEDFSDIKFIESSASIELSEFDPNDLDKKQWKNLGFSERQVETILNYKNVVGGKFISKEQFKKCFAVSPDKFSELESYILLPESNNEAKSGGFKNFDKKSITISGKFNPDSYEVSDWMKMGFSERQAAAILKYKGFLGGSFISKEKFKECFIINEENYKKLSPYLILPEKTPTNFRSFAKNFNAEKSKVQYHSFDPNTLDMDGWKSFGFSDRQAQTIINYRDRNLKGSFKNLEDIQKCFVISAQKFEELKPYIKLSQSTDSNNQFKKTEIKQEKTDFSKTDLNTITFKQLLEFGLDEKSAGMIIGFRKKLGGFVNKEQILTTYNIDKELVQKLLSIAPLNTANVPKYTLTDAPEEWLKSHPYFKYSADKIIFYRISEKDERKIWKLLKVKPEYEARMRLYLK